MRSFLVLLALCVPASAQYYGNPNPLLTGSNTSFTANFLGTVPVTSLTGLPLGTVNSGSNGEIGLKIIPVGGTITVTATTSGIQRVVLPATLTTSGTIPQGAKSVSFLVLSGSLTFPATSGTLTLTSGQSWSQSVAPDTLPAIVYTISASGTTLSLTTQ